MLKFRTLMSSAAGLALTVAALGTPAKDTSASLPRLIERGRYLVKITGCNDCHTPGYGETGGKIPEQAWLTGSPLGWHGPWGTTYASNLRLFVRDLSEAEWIKTAHTVELRPPMPWYALHAMKDRDLRAIYQFILHLGAAGEPAPADLPPGQTPQGPYVQFPAPPPKAG